MTVIRPNSVAGINSITAQANDLTLYTVSGASGNLNVNKLIVGSATTIAVGGVNVTGVVTATSFVGDGSGLTNAGASAATSVAIASFLGR